MPLRILAISDWRSQPVELLHELAQEAAPLDLVVYAGDDVARLIDAPATLAITRQWSAADVWQSRFVLGASRSALHSWPWSLWAQFDLWGTEGRREALAATARMFAEHQARLAGTLEQISAEARNPARSTPPPPPPLFWTMASMASGWAETEGPAAAVAGCELLNGGRLAVFYMIPPAGDEREVASQLARALDLWRGLRPSLHFETQLQHLRPRLTDPSVLHARHVSRILEELELGADVDGQVLAAAILERANVEEYRGHPTATVLSIPLGPPHHALERLADCARLGLVGVIGNDCHPSDAALLSSVPGARDLHRAPEYYAGWGFIGQDGAVGDFGYTLHTEDAIGSHLAGQLAALPAELRGVVLVSHCPPRGTLDIAQRFGLEHIGSEAVANLCLSDRVSLVICGHVHGCGGHSARLGSALVVNVACHDEPGAEARAALIELPLDGDRRMKDGFHVDAPEPNVSWLPTWRHRLTSLSGLGPKRESRLLGAGISHPRQLAEMDDELLATTARVSLRQVSQWRQDLDAQRTGLPLLRPGTAAREVAEQLLALADPPLVVDVETGVFMRREEVWVIGALDPSSGQVQHFHATPRRGQWRPVDRIAIDAFMAFLRRHPEHPICCYAGTGFDHQRIMAALAAHDAALAEEYRSRQRSDLCSMVRRVAASPCGNWKLKAVATALGYPFAQEDLDGYMVGLAYEAHRSLREPFDADTLLAYNADDVRAAAFVFGVLRQLCRE
jgi:predicted flap endonuclease-1-like 5' DNA nuclease